MKVSNTADPSGEIAGKKPMAATWEIPNQRYWVFHGFTQGNNMKMNLR